MVKKKPLPRIRNASFFTLMDTAPYGWILLEFLNEYLRYQTLYLYYRSYGSQNLLLTLCLGKSSGEVRNVFWGELGEKGDHELILACKMEEKNICNLP